MSDEHYNTGPGYPETKPEVEILSLAGRHEFMAECSAEPADFENCLACYAYLLDQYYTSPTDPDLRRLMIASGSQLSGLSVEDEPSTPKEITIPFAFLESLVSVDDCDIDHHGGCQSHLYLSLEHGEECPQHELKRRIAEAKVRAKR